MASLQQRLKERKLVQWAIAYLAGAWVLFEVTDAVGGRLGWLDVLYHGLLIVLALGFFVTLILAWYHGEKGRQRVSGPELLMVATLFVIAGGVLSTLGTEEEASSRPGGPPADATGDPVLALPSGPSIAVIPFANRSDDPDDVFFSDGLSEAIVAALSEFTDLFVISLGSTLRYAGGPVDLSEVRDELGVDYLLQGSVRRSPGQIRVTTQLADAASGASLWADEFDLDATTADLFDAQDRITVQVAGAIGGSTGVISRARITAMRDRPTQSLGAYECVLRASEYIIDHGPRNHLLARDCLENAITQDSSYADAWGWLSYLYAEESRHGWNARLDEYDSVERALLAGRRAVSIDPASYIGHFGLAVTYFNAHDLEAFREAGERALELNPNDANVLAIVGDYLSEIGDYERGHALLRKSMALNPKHPGWLYTGIFLERYQARDYEGALFEARRFNMPDSYRAPFFEAAALGQLGQLEEAAATLERLRALRPDFGSIEGVRRQLVSFNHPPHVAEHLLDGLRKAGLPERDD
jgi:adenylate cyclase